METHANYRLVGTFVLAGFVGILLFIVWISRSGFGYSYLDYDIYFKGSVSGLKKGSMVQYRGVPIGQVADIIINTNDIEQIAVVVRIDKKIPIKADVQASLETQGLTGISYIQINGGTTESPELVRHAGQTRPVIPSKSSLLEEVTSSLPAVLQKVGAMIQEIQGVFSAENRDSIHKTLKNIEEITSAFTAKSGKVSMVENLQKTFESLEKTLSELTNTSREFREILKDNRSGLKDFSTNGLGAFTKFLNEGRETMSAVRRLSESIERSPSRFFYNDPKQGVSIR